MAYREVDVIEVREVLRGWLADDKGLRKVAEQAGVDRKTARRYVEAAEAVGLVRDGGEDQLTDELIGQVVQAVRPARMSGHGAAWQAVEAEYERIRDWVRQGLTVTKIGVLLERRGVTVPYRTLHRFCEQRCGFGRGKATVRVADGEPGRECPLDFARMGLLYHPSTARRRVAHALILTAVYSRHMFVWLTFTQTLGAVIAGCEQAWRFFGGVFSVLVPDNASAIVAGADPVNPRFTVGWLDYAQHCGFTTDPTRIRSPKDKPRVERAVQYVRGNFFAGEEFACLADAQARAQQWCATTAGLRVHGTTQARPVEVFTEHEAEMLLPIPAPYDVPIFTTVKVHPDHHIEVGKALYSAPAALLGQHLQVRADTHLVKLFHRGQLVKVHPRQRPGGRWTDPEDLPTEKTAYALRDIDRLIRAASRHGQAVGIYAERLLAVDLPWTRMRQVYRLLGLARRYGDQPVNTACDRALADEVTRRETKSAQLRARAAGLDPAMQLQSWDETAAIRYDRQLWNELTSLRFLDAGHGALLLGPVGVGKTHLATALGHIAIRRRRTVVMTRADKLLKRLKAARLDNTVEAEMRRLAGIQLLILDDFALQPLDATETADFYELIVQRHRKTATVATSNREPSEWLAMMADLLLAQAAVDRLTSAAHELIIEGVLPATPETHQTRPSTRARPGVSVDAKEGDQHAH